MSRAGVTHLFLLTSETRPQRSSELEVLEQKNNFMLCILCLGMHFQVSCHCQRHRQDTKTPKVKLASICLIGQTIQYSIFMRLSVSFYAFVPLRHRWWCCWRSWKLGTGDSSESRCFPKVASPWCLQTKTSVRKISRPLSLSTKTIEQNNQRRVTLYLILQCQLVNARSKKIFLFFPFPKSQHVSQYVIHLALSIGV